MSDSREVEPGCLAFVAIIDAIHEVAKAIRESRPAAVSAPQKAEGLR